MSFEEIKPFLLAFTSGIGPVLLFLLKDEIIKYKYKILTVIWFSTPFVIGLIQVLNFQNKKIFLFCFGIFLLWVCITAYVHISQVIDWRRDITKRVQELENRRPK